VVYLIKQIPENIDRVVSGLILTSLLLQNLEFKIELYLVKQIPENIDRVVSELILTSLLLQNLSSRLSCILYNRYLRIQIESRIRIDID